jgi:hypothetical protein
MGAVPVLFRRALSPLKRFENRQVGSIRQNSAILPGWLTAPLELLMPA